MHSYPVHADRPTTVAAALVPLDPQDATRAGVVTADVVDALVEQRSRSLWARPVALAGLSDDQAGGAFRPIGRLGLHIRRLAQSLDDFAAFTAPVPPIRLPELHVAGIGRDVLKRFAT